MSEPFLFPMIIKHDPCFLCFSEQIYYAGPVNNPGFEIPPVRFWFSVLFCCLTIVLSRFLKKEKERRRGERRREGRRKGGGGD